MSSIYNKSLSGLEQKVIVGAGGTTAAYTASSTFNAFISASAEGEIGVFLDTGALQSTLLTAGQKFFIAQKRDGAINKTPIYNFSDIYRSLRTAYAAPVAKIVTVGNDTVTGSIGFDFTGASASNTITVGVTARDLTPGNQPFPVQEGYATVNSTTADQYTVLSQIVSQLNAELDYQKSQPDKFCIAEVNTNGAKAAVGTATLAATNGSNALTTSAAHGLAVGSFVSILRSVFKIIAVPTTTTITLDRVYQGPTVAALATGATTATWGSVAYTSGTTLLGVRLTGVTADYLFTANGFGPGVVFAPVVVQQAWVLGSGAGSQIRDLELNEGIVYDGIGSTRNAAFREDYGQPTLFSVPVTGTYDQIFLDMGPRVISRAGSPFNEQRSISRVLLAVPTSGTLRTTLQTIFGV